MLCERCLAMAFFLRKPSTSCQITNLNLSGSRGALHSDRKSGHPQTVMSALPPEADMCGALAHVCFGPKADNGAALAARATVLDIPRLNRKSLAHRRGF